MENILSNNQRTKPVPAPQTSPRTGSKVKLAKRPLPEIPKPETSRFNSPSTKTLTQKCTPSSELWYHGTLKRIEGEKKLFEKGRVRINKKKKLTAID